MLCCLLAVGALVEDGAGGRMRDIICKQNDSAYKFVSDAHHKLKRVL